MLKTFNNLLYILIKKSKDINKDKFKIDLIKLLRVK